MINIILLAAGSSIRYGRENKLLALFQGKPLYEHSFLLWKEAVRNRKDCRIFAVAREASVLKAAETFGFHPVYSPDSEKGIAYSIRAGLLAAGDGKLIFAAADQPKLSEKTARRFLLAAEKAEYACVAWQGEPCNPVCFPERARAELLALEGEQGGKRVLRPHLSQCLLVPADSLEEVLDIDTKEDQKRLE